ncbi:MAG TPA: metal ABC transporter substrate-binding protein [bacterium]|nr:metal ABC transporter substrate-binding protein [bacterium]
MRRKQGMNAAAAIAAAVMIIAASGCSKKPSKEVEPENDRIVVVTSIFPLADIISQVGGEHVDVKFLVQPGQSPHTFEPLPADMKVLSDADIVALVGFGFEFWADKMLSSVQNKDVKRIQFSDHVKPIIGEAHEHGHEDESGHEGEHEDKMEANPHYWLSPRRAMIVVSVIRNALIEKAPENSGYFSEKADDYILELKKLDGELTVHSKALAGRKFIAFHSAWDYVAKDYELEQAGVIQEFPGKEPAPEQLARIVDKARASKAKAIFAEPQLNSKTANIIAKEAGIKVAILDPLGGPGVPGRDSYLKLMRYNLGEMRKALR